MAIKKYTLSPFLYIIFISCISNGMYNGIQITKPYIPGNEIEYPKPIKSGNSMALAVKSLSISTLQALGIDGALRAGFIASAPELYNTTVYNKSIKSHHLLDSLLTNPITVLEGIYRIKETFFKTIKPIKSESELIQQFESLFLHKNNHPIFLLDECPSPCAMGRKNNPHLREIFEKKVSSLLIEKVTLNPTKTIHYTSFGAGSAFSELIIVIKTLIKKPDARLHIHLIEQCDALYVQNNANTNNTHEVKNNQSLDFNSILTEVISHTLYNKEECGDYHNFKATLRYKYLKNLLHIQSQHQQFLQYLQYTFPRAQLSLSVHSSHSNYYNYIQKNELPWADVLSAVDFMDANGQMLNSDRSYTFLCLQILKNNPCSVNLWLDRAIDSGAALTTISLNQLNNDSIAIKSDNTVYGYITDEKI